ncbi:RagB/SusD family nutrient uptake outer membrane protein [Segatella copri]|uniref:RagB/SusD family nutrient uptake outer membrane protein n=1 Tax=Segatella copri TaxID=165179 RepID=UPI001290B99E|nr:RagB/SusD family nutrient uptake outer membrane protein [Segatella copri]MQN37383.1 RagB/SusD family nutrient uptake outer membrane protein [Segatella copri]MQO29202.1 RagB/SusD family nutrient uptake outer membrane protein [Segatella copri]MQO42784.1 RagB/SusD family nutrient uptake outer membrane protein [Segatella copri]
MKHIRFQFLTLLSATALTLTSCDLIGSLDGIEPEHVVTDDNYITDVSTAQTALNGVYASWRSTGVSYLRNGMSSMAHTQTQAMVMGAEEFAAENIETNNSNVETAYTAYYNVINTANTFLVHINKNIPGLSEEKRTEMIAEARCQRALAYLTLLKCFGEYWKQDSQYGVCLFKDELVRDNQVRQRSSVAETYKLISDDLDYAIAHCEQHPADHYHMSSVFAKALKAKMYMAQDNYAEAARLAEEVIGEAEAAGYGLESDYAKIFDEQFNSQEMLFAPYTANPSELMDSNWYMFSPGSLLKKVADDLVPDDETGGDIVIPNPGDGGDVVVPDPDGSSDGGASGDGGVVIPGGDGGVVIPGGDGGVVIPGGDGGDFPFPPGDEDVASYDKLYTWAYKGDAMNGIGKYNKLTPEMFYADSYYFMRLAEVYYIAAEAEARQGQYAKARTLLATVIERAGYTEDDVNAIADSDLLGEILKHKLCDMSNENLEEWFDLCRYNRQGGFESWTEDEKAELPSFRRYLLPIPKASMGANNLLVQNPEYVNQ